MSCNFCEKADFGNFAISEKWNNISMAAGAYRFPKSEQFKFCPKCGMPLTEPIALTLEQLKQRDGAVWLVCGHWQGWAFPHHSEFDSRFNFNCNGHDVISRAPEDYQSTNQWNFICYTHKQQIAKED